MLFLVPNHAASDWLTCLAPLKYYIQKARSFWENIPWNLGAHTNSVFKNEWQTGKTVRTDTIDRHIWQNYIEQRDRTGTDTQNRIALS